MEGNKIVLWPGWETVRLIGRGSFGAVYEIERDMFGEKEKAALKVIMIPQSSSDIDELYGEGYDGESITNVFNAYLQSIVAEYSLMRKMNGSANVVNCDDVRYVQHDDGFGWDIFIKMELLTPLTKAVGKEVSDEQVIRIGTDICKALILCKKHNIIHRDIKPANIFVSGNGDYKLGDFGIAKTVEKTSGGTKIGTYEYMAPEVYHDQPYGGTADIYSLGMVLYWLLNERRTPFLKMPPALPTNSEKEQARKRRFSGETLPAPMHGNAELVNIVLKACAFDPKDRYQSAEEMLRDLDRQNERADTTSSASHITKLDQIKHGPGNDKEIEASADNSIQEEGEEATISAMYIESRGETDRTISAIRADQDAEDDMTVSVFDGRNKKETVTVKETTIRADQDAEGDMTVSVFDGRNKKGTVTEKETTENKKLKARPSLIGALAAAAIIAAFLLPALFRPKEQISATTDAVDTLTSTPRADTVIVQHTIQATPTPTPTKELDPFYSGRRRYKDAIPTDRVEAFMLEGYYNYYSYADLYDFSQTELRLILNGLYAMSGKIYIVDDDAAPSLQLAAAYFNEKSWYDPISSNAKSLIYNKYQQANIDLVAHFEFDQGYR